MYKSHMTKSEQVYQNTKSNAQGHIFEKAIGQACKIYEDEERAIVHKIPEPFRVIKKHTPNGTFLGRFTAKAMPDFEGVVKTGRTICFEAKYTSKDRINQDVVTKTQSNMLDKYYKMGAIAGVCVCIQDRFFMIPWVCWKRMKECYGRKYLTAQDIKEYEIKFNGAVMFLDYK